MRTYANLVVKDPDLAKRWNKREKRYMAHISVDAWPSSGRIVVDEGDEEVLTLMDCKNVTVFELALGRRKLAKKIATDEKFKGHLSFDLGDKTVADILDEFHGLKVAYSKPLKFEELDSKIGDLMKKELRTEKASELERTRAVKIK